MRVTMQAVKYNRDGKEIGRVALRNVNMLMNHDGSGVISGSVYDALKRDFFALTENAPRKRGQRWHLETESGMKDTFGGYPSFADQVRFAKK